MHNSNSSSVAKGANYFSRSVRVGQLHERRGISPFSHQGVTVDDDKADDLNDGKTLHSLCIGM